MEYAQRRKYIPGAGPGTALFERFRGLLRLGFRTHFSLACSSQGWNATAMLQQTTQQRSNHMSLQSVELFRALQAPGLHVAQIIRS